MLLNRTEELDIQISGTKDEKQEPHNIKSGNEESMELEKEEPAPKSEMAPEKLWIDDIYNQLRKESWQEN